jgi:hypothetical protein
LLQKRAHRIAILPHTLSLIAVQFFLLHTSMDPRIWLSLQLLQITKNKLSPEEILKVANVRSNLGT